MNYTEKDIVFIKDGKNSKYSLETKDGKYYTETDSDGYSYWYEKDNNYHLGNIAYDYVFVFPKRSSEYEPREGIYKDNYKAYNDSIKSAVEKLNNILKT